MTSEQEPGRDEWRPWGGSDAGAERPAHGSSTERPADGGARTEDTQQIPFDEPVWATVQGGPLQPGATAPVPAGEPRVPSAATSAPAYPTYAGEHLAHPAAPEPARTRRGPGWGALVGVAAATALVAGTVGGLVGGTLAEDGALESTGAPAPSAGVGAVTRAKGSIANIAAKATPSVVTLRVDESGGEATGSGWVYDREGHIVTNNHVVAGASDTGDVTVILANGQQLEGSVVGRDDSYDLAVLKVERTDLAPLTLGRSEDVVVGDEVIAVGAPLGLDSTVTSGIVSALDRPVTPGDDDGQSFINAIQTDAAINPGNSGGPLLDMQGQVIGVNSAIARAPGSDVGEQSGNIGVGFAIPSAQVSTTVTQLIETGTAVHPVIGVYLDPEYTGEGVRIAEEGPDGKPAVNPGGPADEAGLRPGDVVTAFEGKPVSEGGELVVAIRARAVGDRVTLTIRRDGSERDVTMVLTGSSE
jgi:putative serine protease PepD